MTAIRDRLYTSSRLTQQNSFNDRWIGFWRAQGYAQPPSIDAQMAFFLAGGATDPTYIERMASYFSVATPPRVTVPLAWMQYEPGALTDITRTAATYAALDPTNLALTFTPTGTSALIIVNATISAPSGMGSNQFYLNLVDSVAGNIAGSEGAGISGNRRYRFEHRVLLTGLTINNPYTIQLGGKSDATHACGVRVGPDHHVLMMALDPANSILPNRLVYSEQSVPGGGMVPNLTSTSFIELSNQTGGPSIIPAFTVPSSGKVMVELTGTMFSASAGTVDTAFAMWDRDVGAVVAGSGVQMMGGDASQRNHSVYRKIITGLTPGSVKNWSLAGRLITAGTNTTVAKFGTDDHEGPSVWSVSGIDV